MRDGNGYNAQITFSAKPLSKKEQISYTCGSIDSVLLEKAVPIDIDVDNLIIMDVHNPLVKPDPVTGEANYDYQVTIIRDKSGVNYSTSSKYFTDTAQDIINDMLDEAEEWKLHCFKRESKNRSGSFLTCGIV